MTPEQEIAQLKQQIAVLAEQVQKLSSFTAIPFEVERAFRNRLGIDNLQTKIYNGGDLVSNYVQAVNESGMSSYNVPSEPDYMLRLKYGNLAVVVPAYDT